MTEIEFLKKIPKADFIFHTAGYGQPNKFQVLPFETILLNTQILIYLLNSLKDQGKLLYCSSSEIYAGLETPPFNENQIGALNLNHPRSAYVESKKIGEIIVSNFNKQVREKTAVAARISLAYGPGYKDGDSRALNSFIDSALLNKQIRLKDSGTAQRTYCYITDTIEMCLNILINGSESVYNVGGVASISIKELANLIGKLTNVDVEITNTTEAYMPEAPVNVSLDMKKTLSICKKNEFVDLQSGLIETINWRKENLIRVFP